MIVELVIGVSVGMVEARGVAVVGDMVVVPPVVVVGFEVAVVGDVIVVDDVLFTKCAVVFGDVIIE